MAEEGIQLRSSWLWLLLPSAKDLEGGARMRVADSLSASNLLWLTHASWNESSRGSSLALYGGKAHLAPEYRETLHNNPSWDRDCQNDISKSAQSVHWGIVCIKVTKTDIIANIAPFLGDKLHLWPSPGGNVHRYLSSTWRHFQKATEAATPPKHGDLD